MSIASSESDSETVVVPVLPESAVALAAAATAADSESVKERESGSMRMSVRAAPGERQGKIDPRGGLAVDHRNGRGAAVKQGIVVNTRSHNRSGRYPP